MMHKIPFVNLSVNYVLQNYIWINANFRLRVIKDLNHRISVFDFGEEDRPSFLDPAITKAPNERSIRQSAAQTITLVKYLPLLLGDTIPEDDQYWYSFLLLIKICKIAL